MKLVEDHRITRLAHVPASVSVEEKTEPVVSNADFEKGPQWVEQNAPRRLVERRIEVTTRCGEKLQIPDPSWFLDEGQASPLPLCVACQAEPVAESPIPPPGPERDAEIAKLLGMDRVREVPVFHAQTGDHVPARFVTVPGDPPRYSTDPSACDRLVEEMVRRGWRHRLEVEAPPKPGGPLFCAHFFREHDYEGAMLGCESENGETRTDAVSAAALLALRSNR